MAMAGTAMLSTAMQMYGMKQQQDALDNAENAKARALGYVGDMENLKLPEGDYSYLDYAGEYSPYGLAAPEAAQYQLISEDPATRAMQMEALQQLAGQAGTAADAQRAAENFQAMSQASQLANSREGAIRQSMERKGQGGAGLNAMMRAQAAQMGANRAQAGTLTAAQNAALQKLAAQRELVSGAGEMRGQDFRANAANSNVINDFNRFNTQARNRINEMNTTNMNAAQLRNLNTRQDISGRNTGIKNANLDRLTQNAITKNTAQRAKQAALVGAVNGQATQYNYQGEQQNKLGQQGGQMFTNIGNGIAAATNAKQPQSDEWQYDDNPSSGLDSAWYR